MGTMVSVDGVLTPAEDARISVFDRGFLYGDSVYEVVRTYGGVPFEMQAHLDRLAGSAERIAMTIPVPLSQLAEDAVATHAASGNAESYLRIVVTRGSGPIGLDLSLAKEQRRIIIAKDVHEIRPPASVYEDGVEIALVSVRRNLRTAIDPRAKTGNYLNSVMALHEARGKGAYEAVMLDHRDYVTEGASSNVFVVVGDLVLTPPVEAGILEGVTRRVVIDVAKAAGVRVLELPLTPDAVRQADEAFITSSIREIVPVVRVDGAPIGVGQPGPMYERLRRLFADFVSDA